MTRYPLTIKQKTMKTKLFTLLLLVSLVITQSCDPDKEIVRVYLTLRIQLNNFSGEEVSYWTSHNSTISVVDPHSQSSRTDISETVEVKLNGLKEGKIYMKKAGSGNEYDATITYYSNPNFGSNASEGQTIEHIFTWDGNSLTGN